MQGVFINHNRPPSKKAVREAIAADPSSVRLEATSFFGDEHDSLVSDLPIGRYSFVGPDPYRKRNFYGTITVTSAGIKVS